MDNTRKFSVGLGAIRRGIGQGILGVVMALLVALLVCACLGALTGCGLVGGGASSSTTTMATPAPLDLSSNDLSVVTKAVAAAASSFFPLRANNSARAT